MAHGWEVKHLVDCNQHFKNWNTIDRLNIRRHKDPAHIISLSPCYTHNMYQHTHTIYILHNHTSFFGLLSKRSNNSRQSKDNSSQISPVYLRELYFMYHIYTYIIYTYRTDQKHLETTDLAIFSACPRLQSNHFISVKLPFVLRSY